MNWELTITGCIILAAAMFVVRAIVNAIRGKSRGGCGPKCGKCGTVETPLVKGRIGLPQVPSGS